MTIDVEFLFDNQLVAAIEDLIRKADKQLVLISPFIDLDARIKDALNEKKQLLDFELLVLFGKNEGNYYKSVKKDSFDFLKEFPNIEIRYNERLHAKYFQNESHFIITSMNLYDFSLANNIEAGMKCMYASRSLLGKLNDNATLLLNQGIEKVKENVIGNSNTETDPIDKFRTIYNNSEVKYKTEPIIAVDSKLLGLVAKRRINGYKVLVNKLEQVSATEVNPLMPTPETISTNNTERANQPEFLPTNSFNNQAAAKLGYCIRCEESIPYNPDKPYCSKCYSTWLQFSNPFYEEKVCHSCGTRVKTSMEKPVCYSCYKKLN